MSDFKVDLSEFKKLELALLRINKKSFNLATLSTVNGMAFKTMRIAREDLGKNFIIRNQFTKRSIRVNRAKGLNILSQKASVGSDADYMKTQQFGGSVSSKGKEGHPLPTSAASGEAQHVIPRLKNVPPRHRLSNIQLRNRRSFKAKSRAQRNIIALRVAAKSGDKFVYLNTGRKKGIYRIIKRTRGKEVIRKIYDLSTKTYLIPQTPWLTKALISLRPHVSIIAREALQFRLNRALRRI
jgi:hypothetical protein